MFISIARIIKFAAKDFWRNIWLSLVTTSILALALVSVNVLLVFNVLARQAVAAVEDRIDISVYFKENTSDEVVKTVRSYLLTLSSVKSVEATNREEALEKLRVRHANNPVIASSLATIGENPLGPSLSVKARTPEDYPAVLRALENPAFSSSIVEKNYDDHKLVIERIQRISSGVERAAIALSVVFLIIAVLIVFNSIRVAIYTHREEIGIMKLVGASNSFVRLPFVVEGVFFSVFALLLAAAVVLPAVRFATPSISSYFESQSVDLFGYYQTNALFIFGVELIGVVLLTITASAVAVGKYLHR
ncbi:ABC transporter permease [Patescibacteria group bacterium]|nr:MAG: ABC transporter permease [Patescibacteria group bacterium]